MAIQKLPTDYKDDIIDISKNEHRKYKLISTEDEDVYEFEEKTEYIQKGSKISGEDINTTNSVINQLIDIAEDDNNYISGIINGSVKIPNSVKALSSDRATKSDNATMADRAILADKATLAENATLADKATLAENATLADSANVAESVINDFVLCSKKTLVFKDGVCTIEDSRITSNSLVDVYFTFETSDLASDLGIVVTSNEGSVVLTSVKEPSVPLVASIRVRVI